jgi:hypothetical protein
MARDYLVFRTGSAVLRERSGMFLEKSGLEGQVGLAERSPPGLRVHTGHPRPVHDHGLVVARPGR